MGILLRDFNLIATSEQGLESEGCSELWILLRAIGDETPIIDRGPVRGVILARTLLDPIEAVKLLKNRLRKNPNEFHTLFRIMPIEKVSKTELDLIISATQSMAPKIKTSESFRITLEKRRTNLRTMEIIDAVAVGINRKVNLEHPDWVILIQILGSYTGISIIRPSELLNIQKAKLSLP